MSEYITHPQRARHRLPVLAAWLREVSEHVNGARFNLNVYADWNRAKRIGRPRNVAEASACGFEGCALGWARMCPVLRKRGLRIGAGIFLYDLWEAAEFFGITSLASETIFGTQWEDWRGRPVSHEKAVPFNDPIAAAERVERFCRDNGVPLQA